METMRQQVMSKQSNAREMWLPGRQSWRPGWRPSSLAWCAWRRQRSKAGRGRRRRASMEIPPPQAPPSPCCSRSPLLLLLLVLRRGSQEGRKEGGGRESRMELNAQGWLKQFCCFIIDGDVGHQAPHPSAINGDGCASMMARPAVYRLGDSPRRPYNEPPHYWSNMHACRTGKVRLKHFVLHD